MSIAFVIIPELLRTELKTEAEKLGSFLSLCQTESAVWRRSNHQSTIKCDTAFRDQSKFTKGKF